MAVAETNESKPESQLIPITAIHPQKLDELNPAQLSAIKRYVDFGTVIIAPPQGNKRTEYKPQDTLISRVVRLMDPEWHYRRHIAAGNKVEATEAIDLLNQTLEHPTSLLFILEQLGGPEKIAKMAPQRRMELTVKAIGDLLALQKNADTRQKFSEYRIRALALSDLAKNKISLAALEKAAGIIETTIDQETRIAVAEKRQLQERIYNWGAIIGSAGSGALGGLISIVPGVPLSAYSYLLEMYKFHEKKHWEIGVGAGLAFITFAGIVLADLANNGDLEPSILYCIPPALVFFGSAALGPPIKRIVEISAKRKKK